LTPAARPEARRPGPAGRLLERFARWPQALLAGLVDGALGLVIVGPKILVH
jgi:hypothetical protein